MLTVCMSFLFMRGIVRGRIGLLRGKGEKGGGGGWGSRTGQFREQTRPIQMLRRLRAPFFSCGVGMMEGRNLEACGRVQTKWLT